MIERKSKRELSIMYDAGQKLATILNKVVDHAVIGISTAELDAIARKECARELVIPAFLNYPSKHADTPFAGAVCTSLNDEVVHGIPSKRRMLDDGDLLKLDFGVIYKGYYSDAAVTVPVGKISDDARQLLTVALTCLDSAIEHSQVGNTVGDIGAAVQVIADKYNYGIVRDFVGHGIGRNLHEEPQVPNYGEAGKGKKLREGTVIAIEPMLNLGTHEVEVEDDGWTVVTKDGSLSVHVEHTVALTADGPQILTAGIPLYAGGVLQ